MVRLLFAIVFFTLFQFDGRLYAQLLPLIWQQCYGGNEGDEPRGLTSTSDGGYIMIGITTSSDLPSFHGAYDIYVVKVDSVGALQWHRCYGGTSGELSDAILQTNDNGYIFAGHTISSDGDVQSLSHGSTDLWVVKLDSSGDVTWEKQYGGSQVDLGYGLTPSQDGGFLISGQTVSSDGDVSGFHGASDGWALKISSIGSFEWQHCYGGSSNELFYDVKKSSSGGYILVGYTFSNDGDVSGNHNSQDLWAVKIDDNGGIEWQKCFGGSNGEQAVRVVQSPDGGYIFYGGTGSTDGDVIGHHGSYDAWVVKVNAAGELQWQQCLGSSEQEYPYGMCITNDGGCAVTGVSQNIDWCSANEYGQAMGFVCMLSSNGTVLWQRCTGGLDTQIKDVLHLPNNEFVVLGVPNGLIPNVEVLCNVQGPYDYWLAKLTAYSYNDIEAVPSHTDLGIFPNPANTVLHFSNPFSTQCNIMIINLLGQICLEHIVEPYENVELSIDDLNAGAYILRAETPDQVQMHKIIISK